MTTTGERTPYRGLDYCHADKSFYSLSGTKERRHAESHAETIGLGVSMQAATELPQYSTIKKTEKQNNKTNRKPETNKNKQQDNPLGDGFPFRSFTVLFWVLLLQPGGTFIKFKKTPRSRSESGYVATYPYWSGWCIMGA